MRCFILFLLTVICSQLNSQTTNLKLASDIWPPFTNVVSEKAFALELVQEAFKRGNVDVITSIGSFEEVLDGINSKKYDGSAALWKTKDREEYLLYSEPYLENRLVLVGRKGSDVSATSFEELKNKRIAIIGGYAYGASVYTSLDIVIMPGKSDQENLEKLLSFKTDYMLVDELLISYLLTYQLNDITEFLEIGNTALITKPLHVAVRKSTPNAEQIIDDFNQNIKAMIKDGSYHEILELNWIQYDVDGDGTLELVSNGDNSGKEAPVHYYRIMTTNSVASDSEHYLIDGEMYNSWQGVPEKYKKDIMDAAKLNSTSDSGLKLKF
ncbi:substrate-binding periplasmic protein [Eudoraea chungangensis]|uniref:substrate-binding periplasmic protein n=1 Tax=Eudoraea chungangensis TaxID=1481905 RepID=UPI0023EC3599|nr:transporter substrate-binding domain-containing protein [Eudoraea chungangensis]